MKKIIAVFLLLTLSFSLFSCGKDKKGDEVEFTDYYEYGLFYSIPSDLEVRNLSYGDITYVKDDIYELGKTTITENGVTFAIYDRERTICDMFKHRGKVDNEMFSKAVNAYANDTHKNLIALSDYAKKLRVYNKVMDIMEILLHS